MQTDIHALNGIRTHVPGVRASEDISYLRLRGNCGRTVYDWITFKWLNTVLPNKLEPGQLRRYRERLRAGRPAFYSRHGQQILLYSTASRPALEPTQPPILWVPVLFPLGTWSWLFTSIQCQSQGWNYTFTPPSAFMASCLINWIRG
jgi:hypothetical protein